MSVSSWEIYCLHNIVCTILPYNTNHYDMYIGIDRSISVHIERTGGVIFRGPVRQSMYDPTSSYTHTFVN